MFILDAHLDLAMNALEWNRDLRWSVEEIRHSETGLTDKSDRSRNTVSFEAMRRGQIGICVATQIARYVKKNNPLAGWRSPEQAWAQTQGQLNWYREMERAGEMTQITNFKELQAHFELWNSASMEKKPIGYILSLEGADSLVTPDYLQFAYDSGLRAIGPAHYGPGTYAFGTDAIGGIGYKGRALLKEVERLNLILDATHLCDQSFWETMEVYSGPVWASHSNCRRLVDHNRQFSDEQLLELIRRKAVIGVSLDAWMLVPNWIHGTSTPRGTGLSLEQVLNNIDHICELAGDSLHVGIGSDLDGGFGTEQCPADLDTIADLQKLPALLLNRGYSQTDIENIMHKNFMRFLEHSWQ